MVQELKGWSSDLDKRMQLNRVIVEILLDGPTRVVITNDGLAVPPQQFGSYKFPLNCKPMTVYIRDDGWSLGVPAQFTQVGFEMWKESWVAAISVDARVPLIAEIRGGVLLPGSVLL